MSGLSGKSAKASRTLCVALALSTAALAATAAPVYWNVFNVEGENTQDARLVTYATLDDMLMDRNRVRNVVPGTAAPQNVVGGDSDGTVFWSVFNIEGEDVQPARFVVYDTLDDMLTDSNRRRTVQPGPAAPQNIVGSGSDGRVYWNVFNIEGEDVQPARFVVYDTLDDMLTDSTRRRTVQPGPAAPQNIVGSGSDGSSYWNVFNIEVESVQSALFVVYGTLDDMLFDRNRLRTVAPGTAAPQNIVGSGATIVVAAPPPGPAPVPVPSTAWLAGLGVALLAARERRSRRRRAAGPLVSRRRSPG